MGIFGKKDTQKDVTGTTTTVPTKEVTATTEEVVAEETTTEGKRVMQHGAFTFVQ